MIVEDKLAELSKDEGPAEAPKDDRVLKALELMDSFEQDVKDEMVFAEALDKLTNALSELKEGGKVEEEGETKEEEDKEVADKENEEDEHVPLNVPPLNQVL